MRRLSHHLFYTMVRSHSGKARGGVPSDCGLSPTRTSLNPFGANCSQSRFGDKTTQILTTLSPKRDCAPKKVQKSIPLKTAGSPHRLYVRTNFRGHGHTLYQYQVLHTKAEEKKKKKLYRKKETNEGSQRKQINVLGAKERKNEKHCAAVTRDGSGEKKVMMARAEFPT